ncbi:FMN-dependent NADH-azoreductase [compost metagenome]
MESRGGQYSATEAGRAMEHQETYLQTIFGFIGVTDVQFVRAEGLGMGPEARAAGIANGQAEIARAVATPLLEAQAA